MICEKCKEESKKYKVFCRHGATSTLLCGGEPYYDEEGNIHIPPDPNIYTSSYYCSNGHNFEVSRREGECDKVRFY